MGGSFRSIQDTLVHLFAAEWAWHSRWNGVSPTALSRRESFPTSPRCVAMDGTRTAGARTRRRRRRRGGPPCYDYKSLAGAPGRSPLWQMVQHLVNHASYHRGQVTTMLRQIGAAPAKSLDLIAFYRERA